MVGCPEVIDIHSVPLLEGLPGAAFLSMVRLQLDCLAETCRRADPLRLRCTWDIFTGGKSLVKTQVANKGKEIGAKGTAETRINFKNVRQAAHHFVVHAT